MPSNSRSPMHPRSASPARRISASSGRIPTWEAFEARLRAFLVPFLQSRMEHYVGGALVHIEPPTSLCTACAIERWRLGACKCLAPGHSAEASRFLAACVQVPRANAPSERSQHAAPRASVAVPHRTSLQPCCEQRLGCWPLRRLYQQRPSRSRPPPEQRRTQCAETIAYVGLKAVRRRAPFQHSRHRHAARPGTRPRRWKSLHGDL